MTFDIDIGDFAFLHAVHEFAEGHPGFGLRGSLALEQTKKHHQQKADNDEERDILNEAIQEVAFRAMCGAGLAQGAIPTIRRDAP